MKEEKRSRRDKEKDLDSESGILIFENQAWMTSEEAAKYLRRSVGQVRNMVWRRQLRARKYCRRLYFKRLELDKAIESPYTGGF